MLRQGMGLPNLGRSECKALASTFQKIAPRAGSPSTKLSHRRNSLEKSLRGERF
jgi:hypothetical protein